MMKNSIRVLFILVVTYLFYTLYQQKLVIELASQKIIEKEILLKDIDEEKRESLKYLNSIRKRAGMVAFYINDKLEFAAQSHSEYLITNDKIGHFESKGNPKFFGVGPADRALNSGYSTHMVIENISSHSRDYKDSIDGLMSAIYHRFGFLDFQVDEIGIGILQDVQNRKKNAYVYNMGIYELDDLCENVTFDGIGKYVYNVCFDKDKKVDEYLFEKALNANRIHNKRVVVYPVDMQKGVPPAFFDEIPDPLPNHRVSGFPISISFNEYYFKRVKIERFKLFDSEGKEVEETLVYNHITDPNSKFKKFEFALFPLERLAWNSRYHVEVEYTADGKKTHKKWWFKTEELQHPLHVVTTKNSSFEIEEKKPYIFYFEPNSKTDILGDLKYPASLDIEFIDKNTIQLIVIDKDRDSYDLQFGVHQLTLKIL